MVGVAGNPRRVPDPGRAAITVFIIGKRMNTANDGPPQRDPHLLNPLQFADTAAVHCSDVMLPFGRVDAACAMPGSRVGGDWKRDGDGGDLAGCACSGDRAAGSGDDAVGDGEPEPGAVGGIFCGEERFEDPFQGFVVDAVPGVADGDDDPTAR